MTTVPVITHLCAVQSGVMDPADQMLVSAMDRATALLGCMGPVDYMRVRGQVNICNKLSESELGTTKGIRWSFSIDSDVCVPAGGVQYINGLKSQLGWLRETVWRGMLEEGELAGMQWAMGNKLADDPTFKKTMCIALDAMKKDRYVRRIMLRNTL